MVDLIAVQIAVVTLYASLWFLVALKLRRNDVADIAWGAGFIVLALVGTVRGGGHFDPWNTRPGARGRLGPASLVAHRPAEPRKSRRSALPEVARRMGELMRRYGRISRCSCSKVF